MISVEFINVKFTNQSIKICKFCHFLPAFLIHDIQNYGLVISGNMFSPSLQVGGKIEREASA